LLYLIDANVLIDANNRYYPLNRIPQFWGWVIQQAQAETIKMPIQAIGEIQRYDAIEDSPEDHLLEWIEAHLDLLEFRQEPIVSTVLKTYEDGYGIRVGDATLGDLDLVSQSADPFLVSYALERPEDRCVVTLEKVQTVGSTLPKPENRKIPLVCKLLELRCIDTFQLIRELDFRIPEL